MFFIDTLLIGASAVLIAELNNKLSQHIKKIEH